MKSKEAWNKIKRMIIDAYGYEYEKDLETIEKDLEVLEILTEIIKDGYDYHTGGWIEFCIDDSWEWWEQDEKEKLKEKRLWEWVNDKQRSI